jgi:arsenite transporter
MMALLSVIGRKASLVLALGIVLGLVLPEFGGVIDGALPVLVMLLLAAAMIRVDLPQVLSHLRRPMRMGLILFFLMAAIPVAVHGLATVFNLSPILHTGLVLVACAPPLASSPSMAALLGLDDALVLNIMVVGTLIVPLTAPALTLSILDLPIDLDVTSLLLRLSMTIGVALIGAIIIRRALGRRLIEAHTDVLDGISAVIMVIFAIVIMNGIGVAQMQNPWRVLHVFGVVLLANWGLHILTGATLIAFSGSWKSGTSTIFKHNGAIALLAGNRNMALFLAALPAETAGSLFLFIALYQLPVYLTPVMAAPLYRRLLAHKPEN